MVLKFYLDESGKLGDPQHTATAVAGAIGRLDQWDKFEPEWMRVLNEFYVGEFHMKYLAHKKMDFDGWDEGQRIRFFQALSPVMDRYILKPIGAVLAHQHFTSLPGEIQRSWGDPYLICFEYAVRWALQTAADLYPDEEIEIIYDEQPNYPESWVNNIYLRCKRYLSEGHRVISCAPAESERVPGLQMADWVAYELRKLHEHALAGKNVIDDMRWPMAELIAKKMCEFEFFTDPPLAELEPLPRISYTS